MNDYIEKLKDPRWQKKRLEIFERDNWCCQSCYEPEKTLHVHHKFYFENTEPWDIDNDYLITLCDECHREEKEHIKEVKHSLIQAVCKKFLSTEIQDLACAIYHTPLPHLPEVVMSAITWNIEYNLKNIVNQYLSRLGRL